jgi:ribosome-interacting GTPase 1
MPANLTPQYQKAEEEYRKAQSPEERVDCLQQMLQLIPKHKGTEKLQADLKSRLKEAKAEFETEKKGHKKGPSHKVLRQGAGQVVLIGAPNSGKSRILKDLTHAQPEVADYPFTTREPMPGMMPWEDVSVQLIDTPPITDSHLEPYLVGMVRGADAVLLCLDGSADDAPDETAAVVAQLESRKTLLADRTGFDEEDFSIVRLRTLLVVTRGDDPQCDDRLAYLREVLPLPFPMQKVELNRMESREELRHRIFGLLNVIRVYTKRPGKPADYEDPFTIAAGGTIDDLALKVHREMAEKLKFARIWGTGVHDGQSVGREHQLFDRDLVELHW